MSIVSCVRDHGNVFVNLEMAGARWLRIRPLTVHLLGQEGAFRAEYESIEGGGSEDAFIGRGTLEMPEGTVLRFEDFWHAGDDLSATVDRVLTVERCGRAEGLRVEIDASTTESGLSDEDWQFFIPGALYNRNDTDHDGKEDYLGTFNQMYREDRLPSLCVLAFHQNAKRYIALARPRGPRTDANITLENVRAREFLSETEVGSLGLVFENGKNCLGLRASYPFVEETTWALNLRGDGWAAYSPVREGVLLRVSYEFRMGTCGSLTEAIRDLTWHQFQVLGAHAEPPPCSLEEAAGYRMQLVQQYYRKWDDPSEPVAPAGYLVHFSPRDGRTLGSLLEYGFTGAQLLLAYVSIVAGYQQGTPLWVERARSVIDFFVAHCQRENGFCEGIFDVRQRRFVYWFTGILLPFQHSENWSQIEHELGPDVASALAPLADRLARVKGNYTRSMCESVYHMLLAYRQELRHGHDHRDWLAAAVKFGEFLLGVQESDGSWYRAYSPEGSGLREPEQWFGTSDTERKSGTLFPIEVLLQLFALTNDRRYLDSAERAGEFIVSTYVDTVEYVGGLNDTTHIKCVKVDSVGVMFAMRSMAKLFEVTKNPKYLDAAVRSAWVMLSWVYLWDVPFPEKTLMGDTSFKSTGWAVCDVLPAGSYIDNELHEFIGDLVGIGERAKEPRFIEFARVCLLGLQQALSLPGRMLGYVAPGVQCEGVMTGNWLSDVAETGFSGAAGKTKGHDNDTVNGIINGQAWYGLIDLVERYGTSDLEVVASKLFSGSVR